MQLLFTATTTLLALAALVVAQIPDPSQLPPCVLNCTTTTAASTDCGSIANVTCLCTSPAFTTAAGTCLQSCSAADQTTATTFQDQVCAAFGGGGSGIPAPGPSASAPAPGASGSAAPAASSPAPAPSAPPPSQSDTGAAARALNANAAAGLLAAAALAFAL